MEQANAGDGSGQGNAKSACETDSKQRDECSRNLEETIDSASSTGGSSSKSSKPSSGDGGDISPVDERKTRKRRNDVLYSRNRRQRERSEADTLREHSAMLTRTNEALRKEETRLLHLYVDATKTIEELNIRDGGRTKNPPSGHAKMSPHEYSSSDRDSMAVVRDSQTSMSSNHNSLHEPPTGLDTSHTAADDASSALASILPQLLLNASDTPSSNHSSMNQTLSHASESIHPWIAQQLLLGNSETLAHLASSIPHSYADMSTRLMSELNRRTRHQSDAHFVGSSAGQTPTQTNAIEGTSLNSLSLRPLAAQNSTVPGGGAATLLQAPLLPGVTSQNTSVEAALLESLVCSMLSGTSNAPLFTSAAESTLSPAGRTSIPSAPTSAGVSREPAIEAPQHQSIAQGGVDGSSNNLRFLLETLLTAARNNDSS
jgi:hypothetical protein